MGDYERAATSKHYGEWRRLASAAVLPYHLGRMVTYSALGAAAGAFTALFTATALFGTLSTTFLILSAALMFAQAFGLALG